MFLHRHNHTNLFLTKKLINYYQSYIEFSHMSPSKTLYLLIATQKKIHFSKSPTVKTFYTNPKFLLKKNKKLPPDRSWVITDTVNTIEAARRANYKIILLANGMEKEWNITSLSYPNYIAYSVEEIQNLLQLIRHSHSRYLGT